MERITEGGIAGDRTDRIVNLTTDTDFLDHIFLQFMASPPEVGADRIVRLAVSSDYQDVTGAYVFAYEAQAAMPVILKHAATGVYLLATFWVLQILTRRSRGPEGP